MDIYIDFISRSYLELTRDFGVRRAAAAEPWARPQRPRALKQSRRAYQARPRHCAQDGLKVTLTLCV